MVVPSRRGEGAIVVRGKLLTVEHFGIRHGHHVFPACDALGLKRVTWLTLRRTSPAGQRPQHDLQRRGVDHESEPISRAGLRDVSRVVEHYALHRAGRASGRHRMTVSRSAAGQCTAFI